MSCVSWLLVGNSVALLFPSTGPARVNFGSVSAQTGFYAMPEVHTLFCLLEVWYGSTCSFHEQVGACPHYVASVWPPPYSWLWAYLFDPTAKITIKGNIYRSDHLLAFQDMPSESKGKPSKPASSNPVLAEDKEGLLNLEAFRCFVQDAEVGSFYSVPWQVPKHGNSVSELHIVPVHEKLHLQQPSDQQNQHLPDWLKLECGIPTECSEFDFEGPEAFGFLPDLAKAKARQCVFRLIISFSNLCPSVLQD